MKLKSPLKRKRFEDVEKIKQNITRQLQTIPKAKFQNCFRKLEQRWKKVVAFKEEYFEGDITANDPE